ncbi:UNVERIFIED_CONTAM: putative ribonuclease H protein [Sesamum calycinum]|uniref:Ribonuclease H protein n=1 Tax=Sesamum calycinum TaxID=2727403 RepID=A0AAW2K8K6_9LAMI
MLQQRAKLRWLKHGDQSSKVFFRKINSTRVKQRVFQITKASGELLTTQHDVTQEFISYFQTLLGGSTPRRMLDLGFLRPELKHTITTAEASLLVVPVTHSEVKEAFFDIDVESAPGRSISDNILLAQELLAGYNQTRLPERCTLKVDIQKARTGLRQGDPMSPYLFVLVMEIWSSLLRHRVHNAVHFQYHWKCKELGLLNLCFADDVLIFCLKVNPAKSQVILSRSVQNQRQQILEHLGFHEGSLPIKYLGIPLTSSRLTIADCRPLLDKVDTRLAGWNNLNLSYAGRLQLIKSVLSTLHTYWASVFILPKGVLKNLEQKMRTFLWQGHIGRGNAKVAWDQTCKPKAEGGLGISSLITLNQALILKQLWRILQNDGTSIWVDWIQQYRLRHSTVWTFNRRTGYLARTGTALSNLSTGTGGYGTAVILDFPACYRGTNGAGRPLQILILLRSCPSFLQHNIQHRTASVGSAIREKAKFQWPYLEWKQGITWASKKWRGNHLVNAALRATLAALVYHIWAERNNRKFAATSSSAEFISNKVLEDVRMRIMAAESLLVYKRILYRTWKLAWPCEQ